MDTNDRGDGRMAGEVSEPLSSYEAVQVTLEPEGAKSTPARSAFSSLPSLVTDGRRPTPTPGAPGAGDAPRVVEKPRFEVAQPPYA